MYKISIYLLFKGPVMLTGVNFFGNETLENRDFNLLGNQIHIQMSCQTYSWNASNVMVVV